MIPSETIVEVEIETQSYARNRPLPDVRPKQESAPSQFLAEPAPVAADVTDDPAILSLGAPARAVPVQVGGDIKGKGANASSTVPLKVEPATVGDDPVSTNTTRANRKATGSGHGNGVKSLSKVQTDRSNGLQAQNSPSPLAATFDWKLAPPQVHKAPFGKSASSRSQAVSKPNKDLNAASRAPSNVKLSPLSHNFIRPTPDPDIGTVPDAGSRCSPPTNGAKGTSKQLSASKSNDMDSKSTLVKSDPKPSRLNQDKLSATLTTPFSQPTLQIAPTGTWFSPSAPGSSRQAGLAQLGTMVPPVKKTFVVPNKPTRKEKKAAKQGNRTLNAPNAVESVEPKATTQINDTVDAPTAKDALGPESLDPQPKGLSNPQSDKRRTRKVENGNPNGWATEEATDIQDMGDFDFESNLSKFDKRGIFEQIRQEDTTADEQRLHTFNRKARPGTAGGKNLHRTENVLASPKQTVAEQSSADDDRSPNSSLEMKKRISDRNVRQSRSKKGSSRKGSGLSTKDPNPTACGSLADVKESQALSRVSSLTNPHSGARNSHSMHRRILPQAAGRSLKIVGSQLHLPCVSPVQMLELEQLAGTEIGMTEAILTENAGRCIAETALRIARGKPIRDGGNEPAIVVLAGNSRTGSRAIAAARHLHNNGARVLLSLMPSKSSVEDMLECVQIQENMYTLQGGESATRLRTPFEDIMTTHGSPVDLAIDALLGVHQSYLDLDDEDQNNFEQLAIL